MKMRLDINGMDGWNVNWLNCQYFLHNGVWRNGNGDTLTLSLSLVLGDECQEFFSMSSTYIEE